MKNKEANPNLWDEQNSVNKIKSFRVKFMIVELHHYRLRLQPTFAVIQSVFVDIRLNDNLTNFFLRTAAWYRQLLRLLCRLLLFTVCNICSRVDKMHLLTCSICIRAQKKNYWILYSYNENIQKCIICETCFPIIQIHFSIKYFPIMLNENEMYAHTKNTYNHMH